jgi:putative serine protease PepD
MRLAVATLIALITIGPSPVFAEDLRDSFLDFARGELGAARIAEPPSAAGKRSAIGPQLYRRVVESVILVVTKEAIGSGVVVSPKGHILTNWHVVGGHEAVGVVPRTQELLKGLGQLRKEHITLARVLAVDPRRDLALLHVTSIPVGLRSVPLGEPDGVEVGQDVHAIGHPKGLLWSYTEGVVSQIRPNYQWSYREGSAHQATVIQTQTPMYAGSSGGALFDGGGRVVGINTALKDPTLGFAIAVGEIRDWVQNLSKR